MVAELVNLRQARKRRARDDAAKDADDNRAKFGRSKAQRDLKAAEDRRIETDLSGKKLDR
jgi:hypothetical protein